MLLTNTFTKLTSRLAGAPRKSVEMLHSLLKRLQRTFIDRRDRLKSRRPPVV